ERHARGSSVGHSGAHSRGEFSCPVLLPATSGRKARPTTNAHWPSPHRTSDRKALPGVNSSPRDHHHPPTRGTPERSEPDEPSRRPAGAVLAGRPGLVRVG